MHKEFESEILNRRSHLGNLAINWRLVLKQISNKQGVRVWNGFNWLGTGFSAGSCELGNEVLGSINDGQVLDLP
jgi:hypothetical protein